jgi:hypothetical protein
MATPRKEFPYQEPPRVKKVKDNLVENFGYGKIEARRLAYEIVEQLDKYANLEELRLANLRKAQEQVKQVYDNHTRPKTILEQRMEAKGANLRVQVREV